MIGHNPYHLHRIRFTELSEIYTSETIKLFAYSIIGIFIPIYLLKNGVSFQTLCLLFLLQNVIRFFIEHVVGRAVARYGAKHILAISYPVSFLYILLLAFYPTHPTSLVLIAAVWAVADSMHWVAYQSVFSKAKNKKSSGREISFMHILGVIVGAIGPAIGGFIALKYGLNKIFLLAPILLILAMIPLYMTIETVRTKRLKFTGMIRTIKGDMLAHAALSYDVVIGTVLWPLFIYLIVDNYFKLGIIVSMSFLISILALILIGKATDSLNKKRLVLLGSSGMVGVNTMRSLATTFWYAFGVNISATILGPLLSTPLFSVFYSHADRTRRIEYTVLMEMAGDLSRASFWAILFVLSQIATQNNVFRIAFILAAAALIATNFVQLRLNRKTA